MKIFFPRNIPGGRLNMSINIGPLSVSIVQLVIVAMGVGLTLAVANGFIRNGMGKAMAFLLALPILLIFILVAFFKYSELRLHEFVAKMIRTHFLDATKKYQVNYARPDPVSVLLAKARKTDHDIVVQQKDLYIDDESIEKFNVFSNNS